MRIGIECQRLFREKKHGMEIVALELIKNLQQLDKVNEYLIFVKDDIDNKCVLESENFKLIKIPSYTFADWEQINLPSTAHKYKLDLLHCTANTAPVLYEKSMILTLHDIIYLESFNLAGSSYQNIGNLYRRFIVPKIIHKCDQIITVSNFEKEQIIEKCKLSEDRVKVIYNGLNSKFRKYKESEVRDELNGITLPEQFILFFGNTAPKKNTIGVLKAYSLYVKETKDPLPLVITDMNQSSLSELLLQLNVPSLISKICLPGYVANNKVPYLYNKANLFLYPSLRESFGLPIIESMACGTPVITSNTSSMPEIADGAALTIDPLKPEAIAEAITKILSNSVLYNELVEKGFKRSSTFSWNQTARKTLEVYNYYPSPLLADCALSM